MERLEVSTEELEVLLEHARWEPLREEGYEKLRAAIRTLAYVTELLEKKETSLAALRELLLCPATTEKTAKLLEHAGVDAGQKKYDETAASMIALLRYGNRFPWNRLASLEQSLGIPLPAATQCQIAAETAAAIRPAFDELVRQAAQGELVHNDDTSMRVLSLDRGDVSPERTGVFTSGLVWIVKQRRIALFFTGAKHAGENLAEVLGERSRELPPPNQGSRSG